MWQKALGLASRITHPHTVAVFVAVLVVIVLLFSRKAKNPRIAWLLALPTS